MSMLVRLIAIVSMSAGLFFMSPVAAQADTPRHVSKSEFGRVSKGMSITRVHRIFDTRGKQTAYYDGYRCGTRYGWCPEQDREYRTRSRWGSVNIYYKKRRGVWRVTGKYAYWG